MAKREVENGGYHVALWDVRRKGVSPPRGIKVAPHSLLAFRNALIHNFRMFFQMNLF